MKIIFIMVFELLFITFCRLRSLFKTIVKECCPTFMLTILKVFYLFAHYIIRINSFKEDHPRESIRFIKLFMKLTLMIPFYLMEFPPVIQFSMKEQSQFKLEYYEE